MKLSELRKGEKARIVACGNKLPLKLLEMGCLQGREIQFLYAAPWGSPCYYRLGKDYIALDRALTEHIEIRKIHEAETNLAARR